MGSLPTISLLHREQGLVSFSAINSFTLPGAALNEHASSECKEELLWEHKAERSHVRGDGNGLRGRGAVNKGNKRRKGNKYCHAGTRAVMESGVKRRREEMEDKRSKQELKSKRE